MTVAKRDQARVDQIKALMADLEMAETPLEIAQVVSRAEALREVAQRARLADEQLRELSMISLRAQRRAGEVIMATPRAGRGRPTADSNIPTMGDLLEMPQKKAQHLIERWQAVAEIPAETFEEYLSDHHRMPSRAGLLRYGRPVVPKDEETSVPPASHDVIEISKTSDLETAERCIGAYLSMIKDLGWYEQGDFSTWQEYLASLTEVRLNELADQHEDDHEETQHTEE